MGSLLAVISGPLSMPLTFFVSNDAFHFGILPVLCETAAHCRVGGTTSAWKLAK